MKRRAFISTAATGLALSACSQNQSGSLASSSKKVRWRLASSFPRSLDTLFGASDVVAEQVSKMTNGNFMSLEIKLWRYKAHQDI